MTALLWLSTTVMVLVVIVLTFISLSKLMVMVEARGTPVAPLAGLFELTCGGAELCMAAEQLAVVPPFSPAQLQVQGPEPVTALALPVVQRLVLGAAVKVPPWAVPHAPSTGIGVNVAATVQLAVTAFVVYVKDALPLAGEPPQVPPTEAL